MTKPYAEVIGDPIAQSKSPAIHGFWLDRAGIDADYRHCHVHPADLADYICQRRGDPDWRGCNVTMPHKQAIMPLLDRIEPVAARIGAVNTVIPVGGELVGTNTDAAGFLEPLQADLAKAHYFRMARVIGTGGAARAIIAALADEGLVLVVAGRDTAKARSLLDELDPGGEHHVASLASFAEPTDFAFDDREACLDLVVNATSLGMTGQPELAFDFSHVPPGSICYDIVTAPLRTPFLADAERRGLRTIDGLAMLIGQAAVAFERFFGRPPPRDPGDAGLRRILAA